MRKESRLSVEDLAPYLVTAPEAPVHLDWTTVFGNPHPVEIEVGFGKGLFLLTSAQARPEVNFLGIEISRKYQLFAATRMAKRKLRNVLLANGDARQFLQAHVASTSCQAVHVYFPDPWWKKRHLKRRVFTAEFAAACERVLMPGGRLYLATDVEEYFGVMTRLVAEQTRLKGCQALKTESGCEVETFSTNFERKFRLAGRAIYRAAYER